jgi:uncharacterized integral membrane protein
MSTSPNLDVQTSLAGLGQGRRRDIAYRIGIVLQVLGAAVLAVLYPLESPFYTAGIMLFDLGVLVSGLFFLVWISWIRRLVLGAVLLGIPLQIAGLNAQPEYAGGVILAGIGLVCVSAAGMAGKEAYCFAYREGWMIMWSLPVVIIANLALRENRVFNALSFSALFLLFLSLASKRLKQPLPPSCGDSLPPSAT